MDKEKSLLGALKNNVEALATITTERLIKIDSERMSEEEVLERAKDCELFFEKHFEKVIDMFILEELKYLGNEAQNEFMLLFARGHISAYNKLKNWFIQQKSISISRFEETEEG